MPDVLTVAGVAASAIGVEGVLVRISYQLGTLVNEFRSYVKNNDMLVSKIDTRVTTLEARRR
jgi:hypothetical protein